MAKGSRGGQRAKGSLSGGGNIQPTATPQTQVDDTQQAQVDDTQTASAFSAEYDAFMAMSDDDKADVILDAKSKGVPDHLAQNDFQRLIYNAQMNDKPDVVSDDVLDTMTGVEMFRTVDSAYNSKTDIGYTAKQMVKQVQGGRITYTDGAASVLGKGIYFAGASDGYNATTAFQHSTHFYGSHAGDVNKTAVMRAKLNNNAKIADYNTMVRKANAEINSGSKLGRALKKCDYDSQASIYALAKGYNVLKNGNYYNVLNRNAMTMSSSIKSSQNGRGSWQTMT